MGTKCTFLYNVILEKPPCFSFIVNLLSKHRILQRSWKLYLQLWHYVNGKGHSFLLKMADFVEVCKICSGTFQAPNLANSLSITKGSWWRNLGIREEINLWSTVCVIHEKNENLQCKRPKETLAGMRSHRSSKKEKSSSSYTLSFAFLRLRLFRLLTKLGVFRLSHTKLKFQLQRPRKNFSFLTFW